MDIFYTSHFLQTSICWSRATDKTHESLFGLECHIGAWTDPFFTYNCQLTMVVWQYSVYCVIDKRWNCQALRFVWLTPCLRIKLFKKVFELYELWSLLGRGQEKNSVVVQSTYNFEDIFIWNVDRVILKTVRRDMICLETGKDRWYKTILDL